MIPNVSEIDFRMARVRLDWIPFRNFCQGKLLFINNYILLLIIILIIPKRKNIPYGLM